MEEKKRLTLSKNKMIAGVCGGMAEYFGWDPTLVRVAYVFLSIFTAFTGVLVYIVFWMVMPKPDTTDL